MTTEFEDPVIARLRELALGYPGVEESGSCTKMAYKAGKKGFVYLGEKDEETSLLLKLADEVQAAAAAHEEDGVQVKVGVHNWVTITLKRGFEPKAPLADWIDHSYRISAPKKLLKELDDQ